MLEIAQVHSFLLGYLSGQLGLVMVPLVDVTLWSQPAVGGELGEGDHQEPHRVNAPLQREKATPSCLPSFFLKSPREQRLSLSPFLPLLCTPRESQLLDSKRGPARQHPWDYPPRHPQVKPRTLQPPGLTFSTL